VAALFVDENNIDCGLRKFLSVLYSKKRIGAQITKNHRRYAIIQKTR
jgi:hypothetical protein